MGIEYTKVGGLSITRPDVMPYQDFVRFHADHSFIDSPNGRFAEEWRKLARQSGMIRIVITPFYDLKRLCSIALWDMIEGSKAG